MSDVQGTRRGRSVGTAVLVVVATLGLLVSGVGDPPAVVRLAAAAVAVGAGAGSLALSRNRSALARWYAIFVAVVVVRLVLRAWSGSG